MDGVIVFMWLEEAMLSTQTEADCQLYYTLRKYEQYLLFVKFLKIAGTSKEYNNNQMSSILVLMIQSNKRAGRTRGPGGHQIVCQNIKKNKYIQTATIVPLPFLDLSSSLSKCFDSTFETYTD